MLSRINASLYKYYFLTWVMILSLFKRQVPKWLRKRATEVLDIPAITPEVEKYVK